MTAPRIGYAHTGTSSQLTTLADPALRPYGLRELYLPDAEPTDLVDLDAVIVADRSHLELLAGFADAFLAVAERGGTVVVFGENAAHTWLPGITWEGRPTNFWWWRTGEDHGMRRRSLDHPVWEFFSEPSTIWHHHGFFTPPAGATALVAIEEDGVEVGATTYLDEVTTPGAILVTTMDPCFHHGAAFMPGATQLLYSAVRWVDARERARAAGARSGAGADVEAGDGSGASAGRRAKATAGVGARVPVSVD